MVTWGDFDCDSDDESDWIEAPGPLRKCAEHV